MSDKTASPVADLRVLENVPGYRRALQRGYCLEESWREQTYLGLTEKICGIPIGPLTFQAYRQLSYVGSPFLCGQPAFIDDVALFLFRLSPAYDRARAAKERAIGTEPPLLRMFPFLRTWFPNYWPSAEDRGVAAFVQVRREFIEQVRAIDFHKSVRAIRRFVARMLIDRPLGSKRTVSSDPADTSFAADVIHIIATAYGWSEEKIDQLPMPKIFQALRLIQRDKPGCSKRDRAKRHPLAVRFTQKHRKISADAAEWIAGDFARIAAAAASSEPCN
jgi:hypothetical protein